MWESVCAKKEERKIKESKQKRSKKGRNVGNARAPSVYECENAWVCVKGVKNIHFVNWPHKTAKKTREKEKTSNECNQKRKQQEQQQRQQHNVTNVTTTTTTTTTVIFSRRRVIIRPTNTNAQYAQMYQQQAVIC